MQLAYNVHLVTVTCRRFGILTSLYGQSKSILVYNSYRSRVETKAVAEFAAERLAVRCAV